MIYSFIFVIIFIILGIYFIMNYEKDEMYSSMMEGFINNTEKNGYSCPNILIQKGIRFFLYNSNLAEVPGVNPIEFNNLEDYVEFLEWQRAAGIVCPVLYLQNSYDAQGNRVYKVRPSVTEPQGGLPPSVPVQLPTKYQYIDQNQVYLGNLNMRQDTYYTQPIYPESLDIGTGVKPVPDQNNQLLYSDNAMDPNWGGVEYTQALVDNGYYGYYPGNEVSV
jgi:hypothetical protein